MSAWMAVTSMAKTHDEVVPSLAVPVDDVVVGFEDLV